MAEDTLLYIGLFATVVLVVLIIYFKRNYDKKHQVAHTLKKYSQIEVNNILIPDGVGGVIEIEHLLLLEQGILLIETNPISGLIFAADKMENWSQVSAGRSYKFVNPLYRLQLAQQALQDLIPKTPVFCRLIFVAEAALFPKGKPEKVSTAATLEADLEPLNREVIISQQAHMAWQVISDIASKDKQEKLYQGQYND